MFIILSRLQSPHLPIPPSPHLAQIYNKYSTGFYITEINIKQIEPTFRTTKCSMKSGALT